eukprot:5935909-Prorocentrum_lima.AAC.1
MVDTLVAQGKMKEAVDALLPRDSVVNSGRTPSTELDAGVQCLLKDAAPQTVTIHEAVGKAPGCRRRLNRKCRVDWP